MPSLKSSAQQRQVLILGFTLLFSVSLVIIVFERAQKQELGGSPDLAPRPARSDDRVAGDEIIRDQAIARYHSQARQVAALLFANIAKLEQNQAVNPEELARARQSILNMVVPGIYQKLHFRLLKILNNLEASESSDLNYLTEQRSLLEAEFAWL